MACVLSCPRNSPLEVPLFWSVLGCSSKGLGQTEQEEERELEGRGLAPPGSSPRVTWDGLPLPMLLGVASATPQLRMDPGSTFAPSGPGPRPQQARAAHLV